MVFFLTFPVLSGKFVKRSLWVRAAKAFFFGITVFLYQNKNLEAHLGLGRSIYASLKTRGETCAEEQIA
jgi:hypothetical protein